jgi:predicted metal-binding membrane protein
MTLAAWAHVLLSPMGMDDMAGMEMACGRRSPTVTYVTAWSVMMTAMMLPSALPMIGLYARPSVTRAPR